MTTTEHKTALEALNLMTINFDKQEEMIIYDTLTAAGYDLIPQKLMDRTQEVLRAMYIANLAEDTKSAIEHIEEVA